MAISKEEVSYIANLARLGLTEHELVHFQTQLEVILRYMDKLKKLNVAKIPPTAHALDIKNVYRPDEVKLSLDPQKVLTGAPAKEGSFFKVPRVIE